MPKRNFSAAIFGLVTINLWNIIPILFIAVLYLTKVISLGNAAIMTVVWLVLIQGNAEVFLIAFIMAMIIRCFGIEVYKIPTGSMEPTLHGDYATGDRIIADKFSILLQPIKRFEIALFKCPMDKTTNFIKRIVGLPNEELMIKNGDIYSRQGGMDKFAIAKKPLRTQESIWIPFYKWNGSEPNFTERWNLTGKEPYKIQKGKLYIQGDNLIRHRNSIKDKYPWSDGRHTVSDIKFSFRFRAGKEGGEINTTLKTPSGDFILRLFPHSTRTANSDSPNLTWHFRAPPSDVVSYPNTLEHYIAKINSVKSLPVDMKIEPNQEYFIEMLNFDGSLYIKINKKVVQQYDYITSLEDAHSDEYFSSNQISLEVKKCSAEVWGFEISRDIYYAGDYDSRGILRENEPIVIPDGKYLAIGDNIPNSKDGRTWRLKKITLKNGTIVKCDVDSYQDDEQIIKIWRDKTRNRGGDIWGVSHTINKADVSSIEDELSSFVSSDEIFGRAVLVYWPPNRFKAIR